MFEVGLGAFIIYAGIALTLWAMEESQMSPGLIEVAAWVGYTGLGIGFLAAIVALFI